MGSGKRQTRVGSVMAGSKTQDVVVTKMVTQKKAPLRERGLFSPSELE